MLWVAVLAVLLAGTQAQVFNTPLDATLIPDQTGALVVEAAMRKIDSSCVFKGNKLYLRRVAMAESHDGTSLQPGESGGIWRVDGDMLAATQASADLDAYKASILDEFDIDWSLLTAEDMRVPMYSALGAMLYTFVNDPTDDVPVSVDDQANYWVANYRADGDPATFSATAALIDFFCRDVKLDLVFLVDESSSIGSLNYPRIKNFMKNVVDSFTIGPDNVQVGIMKFAQMFNNHETTVELSVGQLQTAAEINSHIDWMRFNGGNTPTHRGLEEARTVMFADGNGQRDDVTNLIILFTDGGSDNPEQTINQANLNNDAGIYTVVVGVEGHDGIDDDELLAIASQPKCSNRIYLNDFGDLESVNELVLDRVCDTPCVLECGNIDVAAGLDQKCFVYLGRNGTTVTMTPEDENVAFLVNGRTWPNMIYFDQAMRVEAGDTDSLWVPPRSLLPFARYKYTAMIAEGDTTVNICAQTEPQDPCMSNPCQNGGICVWWGVTEDQFYCRCRYYEGEECEGTFQGLPNPVEESGHWVMKRRFVCADGWSGEQCDISIE